MVKRRVIDPTASVRDFFGAELRRLRDRAGLSLDQLAKIVNYSAGYLGYLETTDRPPNRHLAAALDAALNTDGYFSRLWPLVRLELFPDRYRRYMELEAQAVRIHTYAAYTVHGLLQTEGYARALLRAGHPKATEEELGEKVAARMGRQQFVLADDSPEFWMLLDENALRRQCRDRAVMHEQLDRLSRLADSPNIKIQVLPFRHGEHGMNGPMTVLWLPDGYSAVYLESAKSGQLIEDPETVEELQRSYDVLRAYAMSPRDTAAFITSVMEDDTRCGPPST